MKLSLAPEEKILIKRSLTGDPRAQRRLYRRYVKAMYNTVIRMVPNQMDAEDILQDSFVKVFQNLKNFKGDSTLGAWIKRITINTTLNFIQRNQKISFVELNQKQEIAPIEPSKTDPVNVKLVHHAIKRLPEGARVIFTLHMLEGYQHQEIAQILNISESTSKSQFQRARKLLKAQLKEKINFS